MLFNIFNITTNTNYFDFKYLIVMLLNIKNKNIKFHFDIININKSFIEF